MLELVRRAVVMSERKTKARKGRGRAMAQAQSHPAQFNSTVRFSRFARYSSGGATNSPFSLTRGVLLNHLVMNSSGLLANRRLLSGIRLKNIKMWSIPAVGGAPTTLSCEWTSTYGPSKVVSDTSMGVQPAFVNTGPPPQSLASFWSLTGVNEADVIAILTYTTSTVFDIQYEAIVQNGETPVLVTASNNGVLGQVYMTPLDGVGAGREVIPQSYAYTA